MSKVMRVQIHSAYESEWPDTLMPHNYDFAAMYGGALLRRTSSRMFMPLVGLPA